jgi:hypothetical protein
MSLPRDPVMLLSFVNTCLRDKYPSLDVFCEEEGGNKEEITQRLAAIGYAYDQKENKFV